MLHLFELLVRLMSTVSAAAPAHQFLDAARSRVQSGTTRALQAPPCATIDTASTSAWVGAQYAAPISHVSAAKRVRKHHFYTLVISGRTTCRTV
eukprot:6172406-Pleurochrysis_carterae.AAC.1